MINLALIGWPILTLVMALRMYWPHALIVSIIGGQMFLPEAGGLDLPLLPAFEKATIPCLTLLVLALILRPGETNPPIHDRIGRAPDVPSLPGWLPRSVTGTAALALIVFGALLTALMNDDRLTFQGGFSRPGLTLYDGFAMIMGSVALLVPLLLGRKYLSRPEQHRTLLWALAIAGLVYSLPALFEVRMSPRLNIMIYGFFPHSWVQHIRGDGFRPIVFMQHGLVVGIFLAMTVLAMFGLSRIEQGRRGILLLGGAWLLGTLVLCKSLGALLIALVLLPVVLFLGVRMQLLLAACIAVAILTYPMLRGAGVVPTDTLVTMAERLDPARAQSLDFRFRNEDILLDKANERPVFGWGGHGRNRIYDAGGSVTDGSWIIWIGTGGWIGYVGRFGLLALPVVLLAVRARRFDISMPTSLLTLVLVANMVDLIPNSGQTPITWMIAGALLGRLELGRIGEATAAQKQEAGTYGRPDRDAKPALDPSPVHANEAQDMPISPYTRQTRQHERVAPGRRTERTT
jgi:hypothetical protein